MEFTDLFRLFTKSGMTLDPETNIFQGGPAEMMRLNNNIEEFREEEEFFKTRFGDDL